MPERLGDLGVGAAELARHIGWDIGIAGLGALLAEQLDAVFVAQTYSRLVIDCNRAPSAADAMPEVSDGTPIPANAALGTMDRDARVAAIHAPYQQAIADEIARRDDIGQATVLVALHSFTPVMRGFARPWEIGVLYHRGDATFAQAVLALLRQDGRWTVGDNEPYAMDTIDYTIPRHAYPRRLPYVELEVRQDLIAEEAGQREWADALATVLTNARSA